MTTTAASVAAGTACGLFWAAFHDPVAMSWLLRLVLQLGAGDRNIPRWAFAAVVVASAAATALTLAAVYTAESFITASEAAQAKGLAVLVSAAVAAVCQAARRRRAARPRTPSTPEGTSG